ncbi:MAG: hypothetical protein AB7I35_10005 [Ramlibacter sp.]
MSYLRRHRCWAVLIASVHLLFAQVALAQYACPGFTSPAAQTASAEAVSPCQEMMAAHATSQPLCQAHCKGDPQSTHTTAVPAVALPALLSTLPAPPVLTLLPSGSSSPLPPWMRRVVHPPATIRNCCWRL